MTGSLRAAAFLVLLAPWAAADVVVLKDGGERVVGRVVTKESHYEVTTDQGLRTFLKDEVERVIADPKEFLGDADQLYDQAKQDFQKALGLSSPAEQNPLLKEAIGKLSKAREAYATTRDFFPEDKYASLDQKLVQVMMLMRLLRERVSSEVARPVTGGGLVNPRPETPPPPPAAASPLQEAFAVLADPAKRSDPAARRAARDAFRDQRRAAPALYDLATAGMLFLSKTDSAWKATGPVLAALQEYFARPWIKEPLKLAPAAHQEPAAFLAEKIASVKKADAGASVEALLLFAAGHLGCLPLGPEHEKIAKSLGFLMAAGLPGTPEGHALRDLNGFISAGEHDLAARVFMNDYRQQDTPGVRLTWSWSLLQLAIQKKKGFDRAVSAFNGLKGDAAAQSHAAALAKSIQAATPCSMCEGNGWLRCTNCHGQKIIYVICKVCNGTRIKYGGLFCNPCKFTGIAAKLVCNKCKEGWYDCPKCILPPCATCKNSGRTQCSACKGMKVIKNECGVCRGSGLKMGFGGAGGGDPFCANCKGSGNEKIVKCSACTGGFVDCASCEPLRKPPAIEAICTASPCAACEGRGLAFSRVAWPCASCLGLGQRLVPKSDPTKVLAE
jgi:hypothetical protein